jgi:hypothetical protein
MIRLAPKLGSQVELCPITDGIHDLVLSKQVPRKQVFNRDCPLAESERARQSVFQ